VRHVWQLASIVARARFECSNDPTASYPVPTATVIVVPLHEAPLTLRWTDVNGEARIDGLPSGASVEVYAERPDGTFDAVSRTLTDGDNDFDFLTTAPCQVTTGAQGGNR
jgi:hypothetical protein